MKSLIVNSGLRLLNSGLTVETWGNISAYSRETGLVYITPSAMRYDKLCNDDIVVCKLDGTIVEGKRKPSIEKELHLSIYKYRQDISAVIHTHPIHSLVYGVLRESIPPIIDEAAQVLGGGVLCAEYALPGTDELAAACVRALGDRGYACILANHGAVCTGDDMDAAFKTAAVLEMTAQVYTLARTVGNPVFLKKSEVEYMHNFARNNYKQ